MESSGRKKHMVSGNVAEIKKSEEAVSEKSVGEQKKGRLSKLFKGLSSKEK